MKLRIILLTLAALVCANNAPSDATELKLWPVDVCEKVFTDAEPTAESAPLELAAAANEYEAGQIAVRVDETCENLQMQATKLVGDKTGNVIDANNIRLRVVGTVPIEHNTPLADAIITRKAPCDLPEVLLDSAAFARLEPNATQSVWVTAYVPKGAKPDVYRGSIVFTSGALEKKLDLELTVFPFELSDARSLYITNWWFPHFIAQFHNVEMWSEDFWSVVENYIKDMAEHRQNVLLVSWAPSPGGYTSATRDEEGKWSFDFSRLERMLELGKKYGVTDRIELEHIGGIDRTNHVVNFSNAVVFDKTSGENVTVGIDEWLAPSLSAVCDLLRKRGEFERAMLHIADEPYIPDVDSWRAASDKARAIEPELKQIDAIESTHFDGKLDVWVPKLSHFDRWKSYFNSRRDQGEFWYYICCHPYGATYPNRFMDLPGARVRSLHWTSYAEGLVGFLHWGYNYWSVDPFGPPQKQWAPGDAYIVYPGENGPLDSVRWEIQRESVEDYEYLKLLEASVAKIKAETNHDKGWFIDPQARAMELARRVAPDLRNTTIDFKLINETRKELVAEIANATGALRLVVQTYPEDRSFAPQGPVLHELYGVTVPGAEVTVLGEKVEVDEDGFFKKQLDLQSGENIVEIVATLGEETATTTRTFFVE